ncbi:MAG: hypothetical protein H7Y38_17495 [Armatimonadetes bacterium]|nr:hypothetical protein [Armatimonadota bacterium]
MTATLLNTEHETVLIRAGLVRMLSIAEAQLTDALDALFSGDTALADAVVRRDNALSEQEHCLQTQALCAAAHGFRGTRETRFVASVLRVSGNIERIGDHAVSIAHLAKRLQAAPAPTMMPLEVERMGRAVSVILRETARCISTGNPEIAVQIAEADDEVDILWRETQTELRERMVRFPQQSVAASHLLFVAHYLERIGDHCVHVAERFSV